MKTLIITILTMIITYIIFAIMQYDINMNNWDTETIGFCMFIIISEWIICLFNIVLNESEKNK